MTKDPFVYKLPVRFHELDPAGIVFFARIFQYAHDAYEAWMREIGFPLHIPMAERGYALPLAHAEADFRAPIGPGQEIVIELAAASVGKTSYTLASRLKTPQGTLLASVTTVHVCVDAASRRPRALPPSLAEAVSAYGT